MLRTIGLFRNNNKGIFVKNGLTAFQKRSYEKFYEEMPKSKEYLSSEDSDSSVEKAPKRKREKEEKKKSSEDNEEKNDTSKKPKTSSEKKGDLIWELGNNRIVKVYDFKGRLLVDIREMYMDSNSGDMKPGKKGISLTMPQWRKLVDNINEIDTAVKNKC